MFHALISAKIRLTILYHEKISIPQKGLHTQEKQHPIISFSNREEEELPSSQAVVIISLSLSLYYVFTLLFIN
jgi:hypothetical protein